MEFHVPVQNAEGKEVDHVGVDGARLDTRVRAKLLKDAVVMYQANGRQGTHNTKTRSDVSGSNRKPWRQKGTGRARAGTRKSPLWRGGGIVFGPHPRDYSYQINRKQKRRALASAMFAKLQAGAVKVVDRIEIPEPRTKHVAALFKALGVEGKVLLGSESLDRTLWLATRNIAGAKILPVGDFNALDVLNANTVVLTRAALEALIARLEGVSSAANAEGGEQG